MICFAVSHNPLVKRTCASCAGLATYRKRQATCTEALAEMTKFDRLTAVLDEFHRQLEGEQHEFIVRLRAGWALAKRGYSQALQTGTVTKSVIASGIEQGIRETPLLLQALPEQVRVAASQALSSALQQHAPDVQAKEIERLEKIVARGKIKRESEYYLVRHHIDALEGTPGDSALLSTLYALEDAFQSQ